MLRELLASNPDISGFKNTGVPADEGQHLQSVYKPAKEYGGPGRFAFHPESYLNEFHPNATQESGVRLYREWSK